jgi:release factor glutamine methyltransferase
MTTLGAAVTDATARLAAAGIDDARRVAGYLVRHALGIAVPALEATRSLDEQERSRLETLVCRRATREPMAKITGAREFWSLPFRVTGATLDPRPDSECAVETALAHARGARRILDFGTGTGCLLLALLSELPDAHGIGVDSSTAALEVAAANAAALGLADRVRFVAADWGRGIAGSFDIIVANPPYIPSREIVGLAPEVARHEPRAALDGGHDGLDAYRALAPHLVRLLQCDGTAVLEIGLHQADSASAILHDAGLAVRSHAYDLGGRVRCLVATHR